LYLGAGVFVLGWVLALALVPVVNGSDLSTSLKATLNTVLIVGFPKIFLLAAIAIMGKPGFAYLKSIIIRKLAPPATVSPARYRIGLILLITPIVLSSIADYLSLQLLPVREAHPYLPAMLGDMLILIGLFLLGGDFWDKLRALFVRDAKAVFPTK
jgi:predicted transporter